MSRHWTPDFSQIPNEPGVYLYKDSAQKDARILYIGKAKDLRKRVTQYFQRDIDTKTQLLLLQARHVEWIVTRTELEALILEARLIRAHRPPYNIDLKDNKRYAYIKITDDEYPRLVTTRDDDAKRKGDIIGPFTDGSARVELMGLARRLFRLRVCRTMPRRVCLYYHIGQCSGPCEGRISKEEYLADVQRARLFLHGQSTQLVAELEDGMAQASKELRFEEAKRLRDTLRAVQYAASRQVVAREKRFDEDVAVMRRQEGTYFFLVLHLKKGMIAGTEEFRIPEAQIDNDAPMDDFLKSYYQERHIPDELLLEQPIADPAVKEYLASAKEGKLVFTEAPRAGPRRALLEIAERNAEARVSQTEQILLRLQEALRLPTLPRRIDAFDISHLQGTDTVGACVRFEDAAPRKAAYRTFIIKDAANNDFAAMAETVRRRYRTGDLPDLILIDGGKGQLHAAYDVLGSMGVGVPIIALAKKEEQVYVPGFPEPLPLERKSDASRFLQQVRDEIHRFVLSFHRSRRSKRQVSSALLAVPGIGEKTAFALLRRFGSLQAVKEASDAELLEIISPRQLASLRGAPLMKGDK